MPKALWNGAVIAEAPAEAVKTVEGNVYFPMQYVNRAYLRESDKTTQCAWKGTANYFHVSVDGARNEDAAWIYHQPSSAAGEIADHVAFWHGVQIEK